MESILQSIKKMLGISEEYEHFDTDIIMHINSVFPILKQLGIGPEDGFSITDDSSTWNDFIDDDPKLASVKSFMYLKVKMLFDPPTSGIIAENYNQLLKELEWRLNITD